MLHACVQRFDVTENLKILVKFLASKRCLNKARAWCTYVTAALQVAHCTATLLAASEAVRAGAIQGNASWWFQQQKKKTTDIVILPTQTASTNQIPKLLSASSIPEEGYNLYLLEPYVYKRINF
jgi:glucuronate isomerase